MWYNERKEVEIVKRLKMKCRFLAACLFAAILASGCSSEIVIEGKATGTSTAQTVGGVIPQLPGYEVPFSADKQQEISDAWIDKYGKWYILNWDVYTRYYGTYGDSVVFFNNGDIAASVLSEIRVAESVFKHGSGFSLNVYRDGEIYNLEDAYENGILTKEQIAEIAEYHRICEER